MRTDRTIIDLGEQPDRITFTFQDAPWPDVLREFAQWAGLTLDLTSRGMGVRSNRYSMLVKDGKVATLNVEAPGKFEVSDAATILSQAKG